MLAIGRASLLLPMVFRVTSAQIRNGASHTVHGFVYDSVAHATLAGAVVEILSTDSLRVASGVGPFNAVVLSDSTGHFSLSGIPDGKFAVTFQHWRLSDLGIEPPVTGLLLGSADSVILNLSIPGSDGVRALACPGQANDGMLSGFTVSADGGAPVSNSHVTIVWDELALGRGNLKTSHHQSVASTDSSGRFRLCGIPRESPLQLRVTSRGFREIQTELALTGDGILTQTFRLSDSS
jgi:hypothetical protein